jgi:hypothetical protein
MISARSMGSNSRWYITPMLFSFLFYKVTSQITKVKLNLVVWWTKVKEHKLFICV